MRWLKQEIKAIKSAIDGYATMRRMYVQAESLRLIISENRDKIACLMIESAQRASLDQAAEKSRTAQHFRDHPHVYGAYTQEMIDRCERLVKKSREDAEKAGVIIDKLNRLGMPMELRDYLPE